LDVRIKDIADTEHDRYAVQLSLLQLDINLTNSNEKLRQYIGTNNEILVSFENMIKVKDVEKIINSIKNIQNVQTPEIQLAKTEIDAKKAEFNLEKGANKEVLSSIQIVDAPKKNAPFNNFGVRFTLNIPFFDNNRLKKNELAIDVKKAENKENLLVLSNQQSIKYQIKNIENLVKKYRIYADKSENSLIKNLLDNAKLVAEMNATELLDLKLAQQKTEVELIKIEYDIMNAYIQLLNSTNLLGKTPFKNYLSNGFDVF
jgi:outer membrane protein TolC